MIKIFAYIGAMVFLVAMLLAFILLLNFFVIVVMVAISEIQCKHQKRMSKKHKDKI